MKELRKALWIILIVSVLFTTLRWLEEIGTLKTHYVVGYTLIAFSILVHTLFAVVGFILSVNFVRWHDDEALILRISDKILCVLYMLDIISIVVMGWGII